MAYQQASNAPPPGWNPAVVNGVDNTVFMAPALQQTSGMYNTGGQQAPPEMSMPMSRYADGYQRSTSQTNMEYIQDLRRRLYGYGEYPDASVADQQQQSVENSAGLPAKKEDGPAQGATAPPQDTTDGSSAMTNGIDTTGATDDEGMKSQIRKLFIDELLRRQAVSGNFEITQGTIQELKTYPATDPVVSFYQKEEKEDLTGKPWNSEADSMFLRKAMKGLGTDEDAIIHVVVTRCNAQRQELKNKYKVVYGRDLIEDLENELSGNFSEVVWSMFVKTAKFDAWSIREAVYDVGTDEATLIEILLTRSNSEIKEIKAVYPDVSSPHQKATERKLEQDLVDDLGGDFKKLLVAACQAQRYEVTREELEKAVEEVVVNGQKTGMYDVNYSKLCDMDKAKMDAEKLFKAGEDRWGTDEDTFVRIFGTKNFCHLRATWSEYVRITQRDILNTVEREMSGDFKRGLKAVIMSIRCRPMFFAEKLWDSMKGAGTKNQTLIRIIVSRSEIDMVQIKKCFFDLTKKTLWCAIDEECTGDYKKILQAIVKKD
ncbi:hypothetical protein ScPMuIL_004698 [Solemya velum]